MLIIQNIFLHVIGFILNVVSHVYLFWPKEVHCHIDSGVSTLFPLPENSSILFYTYLYWDPHWIGVHVLQQIPHMFWAFLAKHLKKEQADSYHHYSQQSLHNYLLWSIQIFFFLIFGIILYNKTVQNSTQNCTLSYTVLNGKDLRKGAIPLNVGKQEGINKDLFSAIEIIG